MAMFVESNTYRRFVPNWLLTTDDDDCENDGDDNEKEEDDEDEPVDFD